MAENETNKLEQLEGIPYPLGLPALTAIKPAL